MKHDESFQHELLHNLEEEALQFIARQIFLWNKDAEIEGSDYGYWFDD